MNCCVTRPAKEEKMNDDTPAGKMRLEVQQNAERRLEQETEKKREDMRSRVNSVKNRFIQSKRFKEWVHQAFIAVDIDKSNSLDANEIYIAVLLLYLKIAGICKGAVPPTRDQIDHLVDKFDNPKTPGQLDEDHFLQFCQFLCSQIAGRITIQMVMQMVVAPLLGLVVVAQFEKFMERKAPELFAMCTSYVPADVIVTLFVGIGVSLFVPPLMGLVDRYVLKEATAAERAAEMANRAAEAKAAPKGFFKRFL